MNLRKLLQDISYQVITGSEDTDIVNLTYDSGDIRENDVFVCIRGTRKDGHDYIREAVQRGAAAIVIEDMAAVRALEYGKMHTPTIIRVSGTRKALALMAANYYGHPERDLILVGVTGTKGKTTVSWMLKEILEKDGHKTGLMGTNGAYWGEKRIPICHTTPPSREVYELLDKMRKGGCRYVVMEVSSQGLKMDRVAGLTFECGIFTNISPDHIGEGEHKDFAEYFHWKSTLFRQSRMAIINADDPHGEEIIRESSCPFFTFGMEAKGRRLDFSAQEIQLVKTEDFLGSRFLAEDLAQCEKTECRLSIAGRFNVSNALAAFAAARKLGCARESIQEALKTVCVRGRVEMVYANSRYHLMIDYAHNAVSLESLLRTLREYEPGRIICIFGCGGNRSRQRRFSMGEISGKLADLTIITEDNSRDEGRFCIIEDIISGIKKTDGDYLVIPDRKDAIRFSMKYSQQGDFIVLAGKGHEDYQEKNGIRIPFSEHEIVRKLLVSM